MRGFADLTASNFLCRMPKLANSSIFYTFSPPGLEWLVCKILLCQAVKRCQRSCKLENQKCFFGLASCTRRYSSASRCKAFNRSGLPDSVKTLFIRITTFLKSRGSDVVLAQFRAWADQPVKMLQKRLRVAKLENVMWSWSCDSSRVWSGGAVL